MVVEHKYSLKSANWSIVTESFLSNWNSNILPKKFTPVMEYIYLLNMLLLKISSNYNLRKIPNFYFLDF